ncbi:MAG: Nif3-like dinuclear metal center hexameric protein, partial [Bdellovibrionota bacterium]
DRCALEVAESISKGLGAKAQGRLFDKTRGLLTKLVVFVPQAHVEPVRTALAEAGAGAIGNYDFCTFGVAGEGTFRGGPDTQPFLGKPGVLEKAQEVRLETIFPTALKKRVLSALFEAHPYEEVAFDLYSLDQGPGEKGLVSGLGYGFWGEFPEPKAFSQVSKDVKSLFNIDGFWLTDPSPARVQKIAFAAGNGGSFVEAAAALGCDLFITGEAGYHSALDGARRGMAVMELGHRESEFFFVKTMESWLTALGLRVISRDVPTQRIFM